MPCYCCSCPRLCCAAAGSESKRLLEVPDAGHDNLSLSDEPTIRALKQFAASCDR